MGFWIQPRNSFEDLFGMFEGLSHRKIAKVIIATYLLTGMAHHSVYWLYLRELSLTLLKEIGQQALDNALETQNMSSERLEFLKKRSDIMSIFYLWDLLDPYPEEMIETMIAEQDQIRPGARYFILSARGF